MAVRALKQKLEEQLENINGESARPSGQDTTNVLPFSTPEPTFSVVPEFAITLSEAKERIRMLQEFVKEMMIPGQDYGVIPKCDKPSLLKPSAEKLCDIFGFSKHIEVVNRVEDWDKELFHYEVKATLINKRSGYIEAQGLGCCNNKEKRYTSIPACNIINTVLKMAKKRAFIDAVLSATRSSGLFSQDLEDLDDMALQYPKSSDTFMHSSKGSSPILTDQQDKLKPATRSQLNKIQALVTEKNIPVNKIKSMIQERYDVPESRLMTIKQADDLIKYLLKYTCK